LTETTLNYDKLQWTDDDKKENAIQRMRYEIHKCHAKIGHIFIDVPLLANEVAPSLNR